jgi:hypothetical protein
MRFLHTENLLLDHWHPACPSGAGILRIVGTGRIIDVETLREDPHAMIIADGPAQVCRVLAIPYPDRQIIEG